ncbi:MAG: copper homeostasis protein CutC [Ignavibacteriales bacterium]|nr:copper homeostasis protein CutC [Ignavibacteriales bacterium]
MILEVCIDSVASALAAQEGGAGRVELCADLDVGGTTPDAGVMKSVRESISIALHVMIRPRPGDFCYSDLEYDAMKRETELARRLGADGVVFGILTPKGRVDLERSGRLLELARPLSVTFHRAFDETLDLLQGMDDLKALGVDRLLTSGGKGDILGNSRLLGDIVRRSDRAVKVMAGGGVQFENVRELVKRSRVHEVHTLSAVLLDEPSGADVSNRSRVNGRIVDREKVRRMVDLLQGLSSNSPR